jgi:hypothetical protein
LNPEVVYVHIGTGLTPSVHYCSICDGYFGMPHDDDCGPHAPAAPHPLYSFCPGTCACVPCQRETGRYPNEGVFVARSTMSRVGGENP